MNIIISVNFKGFWRPLTPSGMVARVNGREGHRHFGEENNLNLNLLQKLTEIIKNQVRTAREDASSHRILLPNSGLFFLRAEQGRRMADSGIYWCRAENSVGTVTSRKARLQVSCK